jgi:alanyl-tRNA synthetase
VRYGYTFLNFDKPFICELVETLVKEMGETFPELVMQQQLIEKVIREEELSFLRTLEIGISMLDKLIHESKKQGKKQINGTDIFTLYDTYGFPLDLTELILREQGLEADKEGFDAEMQKQKDRARNAASIEVDDWIVLKDGESEFVGYDCTSTQTEILRYRKVKQKDKDFYQIVLNKTPFYAEMGGQVGDSGLLESDSEKIEIFDTKKENNLSVHLAKKLPDNLSATFVAAVNTEKRTATECNHSATHLLHYALRKVLGTHVEQKGSFVSSDVLRFDFSHFQKVTYEEIREVEKLVTKAIRDNIPLDEYRNIPIDEARSMGAMALFGEKYGDKVRVIRFGDSIELCGGTHIQQTGNIGAFRIVSEGSIAAGIRRIEAVTAEKCENFLYIQQDLLYGIREMFNNAPNLQQAVHKFLAENQELKKMVEEFKKEKLVIVKKELAKQIKEVNGINVLVVRGAFYAPDLIKDIALQLRGEYTEKFLFLVGGSDTSNKPSITLMLSDDLVKNGFDASKLIRSAAKHIQGGGGGQPYLATAGGKNADGLNIAIEEIINTVI